MAEIEIPSYFLCPITLDIMRDPVTLSTGITYERDSIEKWIFTQKNNSCPATNQQLFDNLELTPNTTLRRLIQSWCTLHSTHGVERLPTPKAPVTRPQLLKLLHDASRPHLLSHSLQTLKSIASQNQTNKRCMESAGAADFLAALIVGKFPGPSSSDEDLSDYRKTCDDALSIIYSLQLSESGLKTLNNAEFIETLTLIMQQGSYESRAYAVMLLKSMLEVADPSLLIGLKSEFFSEIAHILSEDNSSKGSKSALKLLICACPWGRNRIKAVEAGVVAVLIDLLLDSTEKRACEMMLTVLDQLCQCADGRAEVLRHAAGMAVVSKKILRVSQAASEKAVRILHSISRFSATPGVVAEMLQIGVVAKMCLILQVDCGSKTKERARDILKTHAKAWRHSTCIPPNLISSYPS
ncbi:plant U-box 23 [Perilla frutescens var. frutescens]|nr:plant U-box 23 [Perilla frutescens var. frutescens]